MFGITADGARFKVIEFNVPVMVADATDWVELMIHEVPDPDTIYADDMPLPESTIPTLNVPVTAPTSVNTVPLVGVIIVVPVPYTPGSVG